MSNRLVETSCEISLISSHFPNDVIAVTLPRRPANVRSDVLHQSPFKSPFSPFFPLLILLWPNLPVSVFSPTESFSSCILSFVSLTGSLLLLDAENVTVTHCSICSTTSEAWMSQRGTSNKREAKKKKRNGVLHMIILM